MASSYDVHRTPAELLQLGDHLDAALDALAAAVDHASGQSLPSPAGADPVSLRHAQAVWTATSGHVDTLVDGIRKGRAASRAFRVVAHLTQGQDAANAEALGGQRADGGVPPLSVDALGQSGLRLRDFVPTAPDIPPPSDHVALSQQLRSGSGAASLDDVAHAWHGLAGHLDTTGQQIGDALPMLQEAWQDSKGDAAHTALARFGEWCTQTAPSLRAVGDDAAARAAGFRRVVSDTPEPILLGTKKHEAERLTSLSLQGRAPAEHAVKAQNEYEHLVKQTTGAYNQYAAGQTPPPADPEAAPHIANPGAFGQPADPAAGDPYDPEYDDLDSVDPDGDASEDDESGDSASDGSQSPISSLLSSLLGAGLSPLEGLSGMISTLAQAGTGAISQVPQAAQGLVQGLAGAKPAAAELPNSSGLGDLGSDDELGDEDPFGDLSGSTMPMASGGAGGSAILGPAPAMGYGGGGSTVTVTSPAASGPVNAAPNGGGVVPPMMPQPGGKEEKEHRRNEKLISENAAYAGGVDFDSMIPAHGKPVLGYREKGEEGKGKADADAEKVGGAA